MIMTSLIKFLKKKKTSLIKFKLYLPNGRESRYVMQTGNSIYRIEGTKHNLISLYAPKININK